mgnify:FL=1
MISLLGRVWDRNYSAAPVISIHFIDLRPSWIQVHFQPSYSFHFIFLQSLSFSCLSIYIKVHPMRTLYVGFKHTLGACFFQTAFPEQVFFAVRNRRLCWFTLYSSLWFPNKALYGDICHYLWPSIVPLSEIMFIVQMEFWTGCSVAYERDLRCGIDCLHSGGCCMKILIDIVILEQIHILRKSICQ